MRVCAPIWTHSSIKTRRRVSERVRAPLDTSVVVDLDVIDENQLPEECSIATITLAELSAGRHAVTDSAQRAARQVILQYVESAFQSLPFDSEAARAYGSILRSCARRRPETSRMKSRRCLYCRDSALARSSVIYA
jgi:predicted nucleic acid-binding protein